MTTDARIQRSGTAAVLAVAVLLSAGWLAPAAGADPEFVGVLATAVDETVAKELKLTAEQREKLSKLIESREDSQELTELILASKDLAVAESKEKLARFRRQSEALGLALLNAQQRAQLEQIRIRQLGLETLAEPQIAEDLILSQEQQSRVAQILKEREEQLKGADQNRIHVIRAETERKLTEVLTTQQVAAWRALTGAGGGRAPGPGPAEGGAAVPPDPSKIFGKEPPTVPDQAVQESPEEPPPEGADKPPAKPAEGPPPEAAEAPAVTPGMLRFNFKGHPWAEVLEWFAKKADLSYVADFAPQGTFNYIDPKEYTPAQAIDLLNKNLLTKNYTLVRSDRMLFLVNLDDGVPDYLVKPVPPEGLDNKGESEVLKVRFNLERLTPDEAKQEIEGLIGPLGKIVVLPKSQQIEVIETAGTLRGIRDVIQRIEGPGGGSGNRLQTFILKGITPEDALAVMRPLFGIADDQYAAEDGSIRLAIDSAGNRLLATGRAEKLDQVKEILAAVDPPQTGEPGTDTVKEKLQLVIYPITTGDPESVLKVMQTLLEGEPDVRLATDPKTGSLVALALPSQHATLIRPTLKQYEGSALVVDVIHLRVVDPQLAVLSINKLFGAGGEDPNPNAPQVDADPISRVLLVRGTAPQIAEIRSLLEKMGETDTMQGSVAGGGRNVRMLQLNSRAARLAVEQLQEFWPMMYGNQIRVVTPSAVIPGIRSRTPAGAREPEEPKPDTTVPVPKSPRRGPPAGETLPAPNKAAGLSGGARVFFAAQTVEAEPQPADPEPQPDEPAAEPVEPAAEPVEPAAEPAGPAAKPAGPAAEPGEPAARPVEPTAEPAEPAAEPEDEQGPRPKQPQASPSDEPQERAPIVVTIMPGGVMIASQDIEALDQFEDWLNKLIVGSGPEVPYPTIFYLKYAKAALVAQTLDQILGGGTLGESGGSGGGSLAGDLASAALGDTAGGIIGAMLGGGGGTITPSGSVRITPETRLNALIVQAIAADLDMIERILTILDQKESPEDILVTPKSRIIPVYYTQAERIAEMVKDLYKENLSTGGSGGSGRPSPEQIMQMLRGGRGGSSRGGSRRAAEEVQKMTISVDVLTNSVVVAAPEPLLTEVEQLVRSIDQKALDSSNQVIVTRRLHRTSPTVLQGALSAMMGDAVQFGGVGGSSRTRTSSGRTPTSTSRGSDDARRAMFMEIMRQRMQGGGRGGPPSFGQPGGGAGRGGFTGRGGATGGRGGATGGRGGATGGRGGATGGRGGGR